jgi:hypothetical protein
VTIRFGLIFSQSRSVQRSRARKGRRYGPLRRSRNAGPAGIEGRGRLFLGFPSNDANDDHAKLEAIGRSTRDVKTAAAAMTG